VGGFVILTSAERVLVHLHGQWNAKEPSRAMTQAGIAEGAHVLRSHVPRSLRVLLEEGLVEQHEARLLGHARRTTVYALTPSGVARAREILDSLEMRKVEVDGRKTTLGEARRGLGLTPVEALAAVDEHGRLAGHPPPTEAQELLQRADDLAFLKRWWTGGARVAVVYGSRGMGKTALARAFARTVSRTVWIDLRPEDTLESFAASLGEVAGAEVEDPRDPASVAAAFVAAFDAGAKLGVVDGYGEAPEGIVDALRALVRTAPERADVKVLVLAQETTPAYCRFFGEAERRAGNVVERHLRGLDLDGCRRMLGNPAIPEDDLRRIFLLTKGCPLYLQCIREGDEYGLRTSSRFTKAEIRLLLYSGRAGA
jgi:DNA-binding PadR family transcriptional regulator